MQDISGALSYHLDIISVTLGSTTSSAWRVAAVLVGHDVQDVDVALEEFGWFFGHDGGDGFGGALEFMAVAVGAVAEGFGFGFYGVMY